MTCIDCLDFIRLGKAYYVDESGEIVPWAFDGFLDQKKFKRIEGPDLCAMIERFLLVHRGHLLMVLPDVLWDKVDAGPEDLTRINVVEDFRLLAV
jgi:hypothetical protein